MPIVSTGQITIVDVNDGLDVSLSANSFVLTADNAGAVQSFAGVETTMLIREAGVNTSASWSYYISATGGGISYRDSDDAADRTGTGAVNGALSGTPGYVKVVALSQDLSYLDITAVKGTQTAVRRFSVGKARKGDQGPTGTRGTITTSASTTGTAWSDTEANAAITAAGGVSPIQGDVVTLYNTASSFSQTRVRSSGGTWSPLTAFFGGDVIVDNTLAASKILANSITAGQIGVGAINAAQIASGAITTDKLLVTGNGAALNNDPSFADSSAWVSFSGPMPTFTTVNDGQVGSRVIRSSSAGTMSWVNVAVSKRIPIDPNKSYRLRGWVRTVSGSGSTAYVGLAVFNAAGTNISGDGSQWSYAAASGVTVPSTWTKYQAAYGYGTSIAFPAAARTMSPVVILSYGGGTSVHEVQDLRIEEMANADLIVDGSIVATKLAANSIAVGTAAIQSGAIVNAMIGNAAIDNAKISNVSADKLTAGSISLSSYIQSSNYVPNVSGWRINGDGSAELNTVVARGDISATSGTITGATLIGATISTAASGQRILFDSSGLKFLTGATSGKYGQFKYGAKKYGDGVLVYFNSSSKRVPFYVSAEQNVADIHLYNRTANPTGATYEAGDMICVAGRLKIYVPALGGWKTVALEP